MNRVVAGAPDEREVANSVSPMTAEPAAETYSSHALSSPDFLANGKRYRAVTLGPAGTMAGCVTLTSASSAPAPETPSSTTGLTI
jgi:hypothetical protein